jgi:hypothetical protein
MPEVAAELGTGGIGDHNFIQPTSPKNDNSNEYGTTGMDDPLHESEDNLAFIRTLAGLPPR